MRRCRAPSRPSVVFCPCQSWADCTTNMSGFSFRQGQEAYTDFLLATAWHCEPGETIAAMTPCMRLYGYLGSELAKTVVAGNPYQQWITTYSCLLYTSDAADDLLC